MALVVHRLWADNQTEAALWVWLTFELSLRPGEADDLSGMDTAAPVGRSVHRS